MNTNNPKSSPSPDPNKPYTRNPSRSTEPSKIYANDPSQYSTTSRSTEPSRIRASDDLGKPYPSESTRLSSDYKQKDKDYKEKAEDKVRDNFRSIRDSKQVDDIYNYARNNKEQTITYVVLAVGLITLFFDAIIGGLIVGAVVGYHFAPEIIYYIRNIGQVFSGQDQTRYIVLTGLLIALFITTPGIFIGAAIVAAFRQVFQSKNGRTPNGNGSNRPNNRP